MIRKLKNSPWHSFDVQNVPSKRKFAKLDGWGAPRHPADHELINLKSISSPYPDIVLSLFEDAILRCPSSIAIDIDVMEGQPCVAGTRIPVRSVLRAIEHYRSIEGALECYPDLNEEQVKDALFFSQVVLEPSRGIDKTTTVA